MKIISRKTAKARGLRRYFTGRPCKRGHIAERLISNYECLECGKEKAAKRRKENPEAVREAIRRYDATHRESRRAAATARYAANPEKLRERSRQYRESRRAEIAAKARIYYAFNKDTALNASRRWKENNPGQRRIHDHLRRARERGAGGKFTASQIDDLYEKQNGKCAYCRKSLKTKYHADHIYPLAGNRGSNDISNIQLLCVTCNQRKYNKDPIVFARENGRLL